MMSQQCSSGCELKRHCRRALATKSLDCRSVCTVESTAAKQVGVLNHLITSAVGGLERPRAPSEHPAFVSLPTHPRCARGVNVTSAPPHVHIPVTSVVAQYVHPECLVTLRPRYARVDFRFVACECAHACARPPTRTCVSERCFCSTVHGRVLARGTVSVCGCWCSDEQQWSFSKSARLAKPHAHRSPAEGRPDHIRTTQELNYLATLPSRRLQKLQSSGHARLGLCSTAMVRAVLHRPRQHQLCDPPQQQQLQSHVGGG
jgi:hypothetical protein